MNNEKLKDKMNLKNNNGKKFLDRDFSLYMGYTGIDEHMNKFLMLNDNRLFNMNK
jgi:hypothetical protein